MTGQVAGAIQSRISALTGPDAVSGLGVAVSGGGDSLALMLCAAEWAWAHGIDLRAVTVDHGLRPASAQEAQAVARIAAERGIPHDILTWQGWDGQGNLQDHARTARYDLIADWAREHGLRHVVLGHTSDDQAETLLMRLARGAGVDGLSAIPPRRMHRDVAFLRPMLGIARDDLRRWLLDQGQDWIDDPSNDDPRFDRIKARKALDVLAPMGLDRASLVTVAENMATARKALTWFTYLAARDTVRVDMGDATMDRAAFGALPEEIRRRLLAQALCWISGQAYPPRRRPLMQMVAAALDGAGMTLHGCRLLPGKGPIRLTREYNAVADLTAGVADVWDGRWRFVGPEGPGGPGHLRIAALGMDGLAQCPDWREGGLPHASMLACPALWDGPRVVAAPFACMANGWRQVPVRDDKDFFAALLTR